MCTASGLCSGRGFQINTTMFPSLGLLLGAIHKLRKQRAKKYSSNWKTLLLRNICMVLCTNPPTCIQLLLNAAVIAALRKNFFIVTETIIRLLLLPFWQINKKNIVYSKRILGLVGAGKITFTVYVKMYRGNQNFITSESKRFRKAARHR